MKKLLLLFSLLLITLSTFAQTAITQTAITETFEGAGRLDWHEYATKQSRALIIMDALNIEVLEKNYIAWCLSDLPIIPEYDFKITAKLNVPKINDTDFFGILIDMDKDFNMTAFLFSENIFKARKFNYGNFLPCIGTDIHIKLPESKNKKIITTKLFFFILVPLLFS